MNRFVLIVALGFIACNNNQQPAVPTPTAERDTATAQPSSAPVENGEDVAASLSDLVARHNLVPSDPAVAYDLAYAYAEAKNAAAVRLADSLIKQKAPELEKAYYSKAEYYSRTGNIAEALKNYDAAIAANLYFLDAHVDKGQLLYNRKRYDAALRAFAVGQKLSVSEPLFYLWIAKTQEAMGDRGNAKENYERAFALDNTLTEAKAAAERL